MKKSGYLIAAALALAIAVTTWLAMGSSHAAPRVDYALLDGSTHSSEQFKGKVVLVNFWATSCVTCVKEMPQMVQTYEKYRERGLDFVAVAMNYDPPAYVASFAESRKLPFKVAIDNTGAVAKGFGDVKLTPTTYLINKRGEIVKRYVGEPDFAALHQLVEKLLAEG
ncbi:TlpA family protein disulfide reductase [Caldimonas tepidiphila]|uniref:TlpA family protein disulfide reductase n=1 Tax=Caldimonas tepidiphila TaxID=2315841 RepID=UPI000E5B3C47|nr:TlpA disulfide reductase family protein [Caldimonas tepidiphila]